MRMEPEWAGRPVKPGLNEETPRWANDGMVTSERISSGNTAARNMSRLYARRASTLLSPQKHIRPWEVIGGLSSAPALPFSHVLPLPGLTLFHFHGLLLMHHFHLLLALLHLLLAFLQHLLLPFLLHLLLTRLLLLLLQALMFHLLLLLKFLAFLLLLRHQVLLLLLVLAIACGVSGVGRRRVLDLRKVTWMDRRSEPWCIAPVTSFREILWRIVRSSCFFRGYESLLVEFAGTRCGRHRRSSSIHGGALLLIGASSLDKLGLCGYSRNVAFASSSFLLGRWTHDDATTAAVVAHVIHSGVVDDGLVVNIPDVDAHIAEGSVIEEVAIIPAAADKSSTEVAVAIVDAAIEADHGSPITVIEEETVVHPSPVAGRPEESNLGRKHPGAGHPEVVEDVVVVRPVARHPYEAVAGTEWLFVDRKRRRSNSDGNMDLRKRCRG